MHSTFIIFAIYMKHTLLFLLLASWLTACTHRHDDIPKEFWDSIALHDSVQLSDSLLQLGLEQAIEADDSLHISLICFLQGKKLHQGYFLLRAQERYDKALRYLPAQAPARLRMEMDIAQADLCRFNHFDQQETQLLDNALQTATEQQDSLMTVRICILRSLRDKSKKEFDRALDELHTADRYAPATTPDRRAELQAEMAIIHLYLQQPDSALLHLDRAIDTQAGRQDFYHVLRQGVRYHIARNDSALHYFRRIADMFPLARKTEAYRYMAEVLERRGQHDTALSFLHEHVRYRDSLDADKKAELLEKMHAIHGYRKQQQQLEDNERQLTHRMLQIYRLAALVFVLIILWGAYYIYTRRRQALLNRDLMQAQLSKQEMEIRYLREQEAKEQLENAQLNQRLEYFKQLNEVTIPLLMRSRNQAGALHLSPEDWQTLRNNTDACFDSFTRRLKTAYPQLSDEEIDFCCLVKMELPLAILAEIYHIAKGSISRKKMRLKEKIGITDVSFDEFVAAF